MRCTVWPLLSPDDPQFTHIVLLMPSDKMDGCKHMYFIDMRVPAAHYQIPVTHRTFPVQAHRTKRALRHWNANYSKTWSSHRSFTLPRRLTACLWSQAWQHRRRKMKLLGLNKSGSEQDPDSFAQLTSSQLSVSVDFIRVISFPGHVFKWQSKR